MLVARVASGAGAIAAYLDRRRGLAAGLSMFAAVLLVGGMAILVSLAPDVTERLGVDYRQYSNATARWLAGGSFYQPWQLTGPYEVPLGEFRIERLPVLYPPFAIALFVPFTLTPLLAPAWWGIPMLVIGTAVVLDRPRPWTWPILTFCALTGDTIWLTISGNPTLWTTAAVALGIRFGWPSVGVMLKPTLAPFALIGIRRRSWWLALAGLILLSIPFMSLWPDYLTAIRNQRGVDLLYPLNNVPMMMIPVVAWLGRRRPTA